MATGKPFITANQVTLLRLVLLPIGCWLLYAGLTGQWVALVFMTLLGCTDFIDGWLARKYGSTELGRLMDPVADKVFTVVIFMPFIDLGWLHAWQVGLLLSREFVITALRSFYERKQIPLKTAFLGKVKAWAQMAGCAVLFLLRIVPPKAMMIVLVVGVAAPVTFILLRYLVTRYFWWKALIMSGWFGILLLPYWMMGGEFTSQFLMMTIIGITWVSAWEYLGPTMPRLMRGEFAIIDWVRVLGSIALSVVLIVAQARDDLPPWPIILTMCLEMAVGGLDNLLCARKVHASAALWGVRVFLVSLLFGLAAFGKGPGVLLIYAGTAISLLGTAVEFIRGRDHYMKDAPTGATRLADD